MCSRAASEFTLRTGLSSTSASYSDSPSPSNSDPSRGPATFLAMSSSAPNSPSPSDSYSHSCAGPSSGIASNSKAAVLMRWSPRVGRLVRIPTEDTDQGRVLRGWFLLTPDDLHAAAARADHVATDGRGERPRIADHPAGDVGHDAGGGPTG